MKKRLLAALMALAMSMSLIPATAFADTTSESSGNVTIDKTATNLIKEGEDYQTTVTLNVGGTQDVENVAVLFVLDYSTSVDVREEAAAFVDELAGKENTNVKACVINYWADADTGEWKIIDSNTKASDLLEKPSNKSGTNYHAGLLAAQKALKSSEITGYTTYLITISDGITYLWTDDNTSSATYGQTMSVWYQNNGNGANDIQNGNSVYEMKYGSGNAIPDKQFTALVNGTDEILKKYEDTIVRAEPYATSTKPSTNETDRFFSYLDNATKESVKENYLIGSEIAIYKTSSVYKQLVNDVDYAYAFKLDENHWTEYPYGEQLMNYLASLSAKPSGAITKDSAEETFANVKDQILYEIMSGTVTDIIGDAFDWIDINTVMMTIGDQTINGSVSGNTVTFGDNYSASYDESNRTLTWNINTPVETTKPITLSYNLKLKNEKVEEVLNNPYTTTFETNKEARLDYEDPNGDEKRETFPVPEVGLSGKISKPDMDKVIITGTDESGNKASASNASVAANETVTFELRSTIPEELAKNLIYTYANDKVEISVQKDSNGDNLTYELTFHDVMNEALSLNSDSIAVTINGNAINKIYYTVIQNSTTTDGCTFEITMDLLELYNKGIIGYSDLGVTDIVVSYTATLSGTENENEEFVVKAGAYENTAWVTWDDGKSEKDTVEVITYGINVFKYDQSNVASDSDGKIIRENSKGLSGAAFGLYYDSECTKPVEDSTKEAITLTSNEDGYITYEGLAAGTYYLKETEAPSGYVSSGTPLPIVIPDDTDAETYIVTLNFANAPIPSTGGTGTRMYLIGGACLIVAAGTVFAVSRRKKED